MRTLLNKRQMEVLKTLHDFIETHGYAPTLKELAKLMNLRAASTIHEHFQNLEVMGYIKKAPHTHKAMKINEILYRQTFPARDKKTGISELPVLGFIAAGKPIEPHIDPNLYLAVAKSMLSNNKRSFALQVKGDSLIEEGIFDGDYVVIQYQQEVKDGDIVVAILENGLATLKRIFFEPDRIRLEPANALMEPIYARDVKIQGKVIAVIRKY